MKKKIDWIFLHNNMAECESFTLNKLDNYQGNLYYQNVIVTLFLYCFTYEISYYYFFTHNSNSCTVLRQIHHYQNQKLITCFHGNYACYCFIATLEIMHVIVLGFWKYLLLKTCFFAAKFHFFFVTKSDICIFGLYQMIQHSHKGP